MVKKKDLEKCCLCVCVAKEVTVICNVVCEFSVQHGEHAFHVGEVPHIRQNACLSVSVCLSVSQSVCLVSHTLILEITEY